MANEAKRFLADLKGNVDAWYAGLIDFDTFTARQRATWDAIRSAGQAVEDLVMHAMREQTRPIKRAV